MRDDTDIGTDGFTLIEVLVGLAILAIASGFAFKTMSGGFDRLFQTDLEQQALATAETSMDRVGRDIQVQAGHNAGMDGRMHWVIDISAALLDPPPAGGLAAYPVSVLVDWRDGKVLRHLQLESVRLGPQSPPP